MWREGRSSPHRVKGGQCVVVVGRGPCTLTSTYYRSNVSTPSIGICALPASRPYPYLGLFRLLAQATHSRWRINDPSPRTTQGHTGTVRSVAFSPGRQLATGSDDRTARVWDLSTSKPSAILEVRVRGGWHPCLKQKRGKPVSHPGRYQVWGLTPGRCVRHVCGESETSWQHHLGGASSWGWGAVSHTGCITGGGAPSRGEGQHRRSATIPCRVAASCPPILMGGV